MKDALLSEDIKRSRRLILSVGVLYPAWTAIHHLVASDASDSVWERVIVYGLMLLTVFLSDTIKAKDLVRLRILQTSRWIVVTHYFTIVARNDISVQYAVCAYFLIFAIGTLFTARRTYIAYALYVIFLSLLCGKGTDAFPGYVFTLGMVTALLICYVGLENRLKLIESLKHSENLFRSIFQNSSIGMVTLNLDGKVIMVNHALSSIVGRSPEDLINRTLPSLVQETDRTDFEMKLCLFMRGDSSELTHEVRCLHADGNVLWLKTTGTLIKTEGLSNFAMIMVENITGQKEAEAVIEVQQKQMIQASKMAALGEMSGRLAHEINSPLAIINLCAESIRNMSKKGALTDAYLKETLTDITVTVDRISKIIIGLRKFSREEKEAPKKLAPLEDIIHDGLSICNHTLKSEGIDLYVEKIPENVMVNCRMIEISQVLVNLLNNARDSVKALDEKWIKLSFEKVGEEVSIRVTDSGKAISPETQSKLFQPFFTTKPVGQGTGLGLSISIGIIRSHDGVLAYNDASENCQFVIKLPTKTEMLRAS